MKGLLGDSMPRSTPFQSDMCSKDEESSLDVIPASHTVSPISTHLKLLIFTTGET